MAKMTKIWTSLGVAAIGSVSLSAQALEITAPKSGLQDFTLIQDGEAGGEGGGEGGGSAASVYALNSTDPNAFDFDATPQIAAYVELVNDSYSRSANAAADLETAIAAMLAEPSETTLGAARQAWLAARPSYLKTETFRFYDGPIELLEGGINAWPMNEAAIDYVEGNADAGIVNDGAVTLDEITIASLNQVNDEADVTTGWHAIEFLLWGQDFATDGPGNRPYTDYVAAEGNNDRRREYLSVVAAKLTADLAALADEWSPLGRANYAANLKALPQQEALGRIINGMAILAGFEFMSERLAVALDSGDQEDEHSCFSDNTKNDFLYDLHGIRQVWTGDNDGTTRPGLDELVRAQDSALADRIDTLLGDTEAKIVALADPWDSVLATEAGSPERAAAEELVVALQDLAAGLTDVGSKLGVLVLVP